MKLSLLLLVVGAVLGHDHHHDGVKDEDRACPHGFTYLGEVEAPEGEEDHDKSRGWWDQGDRSPTYSCYKVIQGPYDWTAASHKCFQEDAQLLSVNNFGEEDILCQEKALNLFGNESVLTSGISFKTGEWMWFGAGEEVKQDVDVEETNDNDTDTLCISLSLASGHGNLTYTAVPCGDRHQVAVCEARVYTQTWYYWASANWLSVLFLFTLVLLIISSCVTVQMYTSRPRARGQRQSVVSGYDMSSPPPYTIHDTAPVHNKAPNKYAEKGKEMLAKIVFVNRSEDKQKLTP